MGIVLLFIVECKAVRALWSFYIVICVLISIKNIDKPVWHFNTTLSLSELYNLSYHQTIFYNYIIYKYQLQNKQ